MILPIEYSWLEFYLNNDSLWLESSLNWEDALNIALNDFTLFNFLTTPFFSSSFFFLDSFTKLSFLDIIFLFEFDKSTYSKELYEAFLWDITNFISVKFLPAQFFFYTDYQDFILIIVRYSPELLLALDSFLHSYWFSQILFYTPAIVFDLFSDSLNSAIIEFFEYFILFYFFIWIVIFFFSIFRILKINNPLDVYLFKIFQYLFSISKESRTQFESFIQTFFFFFLYWSMLISTFDDDREELIELFDVNFFYFFVFLILFLLYKYSQHYFAFLEASVVDGRSVIFITKQFFRDFINTFALLLRFFILLFRLNVYDTLDDFYDSYYIYIGDFDDDEYFSELFFSYASLFFYDYDVNDDGIYSLEEENDFFLDLFYIYFICWAKFFTFLFFILEEILRLSLAFYICYLIIFEVHSVNCSYIEDFYFPHEKYKLTPFLDFIKNIHNFK